MTGSGDLGDFLKTRRGQLRPEAAGIKTYDERRRVPGLRREEVALLAGISVPYYTRLEQGQSHRASPEILDAIARALSLTEAERIHLHALADAQQRRPSQRRRAPERITEATIALLDALGAAPAIVLGRSTEVLAWNRQGHALYAGHLAFDAPQQPATRPNMARLVFLDAHTRELYSGWPAKARAVVGNLRIAVARNPGDPLLLGLIGDLTVNSPEFAKLWADHRIKTCHVTDYEMRHPLVGTLTVTQQTLQSPSQPDQFIVVSTASPGSPSKVALDLLTQATTPAEAHQPA
ncbi:helix-turn-helix domain-containing protein [Kribbella sp. CA-293567]|uniref:helix-turn-helix domain-containing protein n=1 Tax=Kribbella sp. CA-293567 TaxID=3002436 RepID=UPI0022DDDEFF|nr:helix-turn-helix transcriptional regulator [Kribbella sp. CA-293567]WBQ08179.1 helix-turn-helix transcriptional regulator [Kribbella sp. CA-293567]